jgi:hypothetical protein
MSIRLFLFAVGLCLCLCGFSQGGLRPILKAGDTLFYSRDLLPPPIDLSDAGTDLYWDMSGLLAPFVHQSLCRPEGIGGFVLTGPDDVERYFTEMPDGIYITRLGLPGQSGVRNIVRFDPPVPFVKNSYYDDTWEYEGVMSMQSALSPREVRLSLRIHAFADATGEVHSPTLRYDVLRERREIEVTLAPGGAAINPNDLGLPIGFTSGRIYVFQSILYPLPVAIVQTDDMDNPKQVEYLSQPWAGNVIQQMPRRPDLFVYPNPSFGSVRFDFLNLAPGYYDLEIYNILGAKVKTEKLYINGTKTLPIDLTRLKKGTYIYRLVDSQSNVIRSKRLVIITA